MNSFVALPERHAGAARLSVFFALWTLALLVMHDVRVNAAPIYDVSVGRRRRMAYAPAPAPQIDSTSIWDAIAQHSDVMSGRWSGVSSKRTRESAPSACRRTNYCNRVRRIPLFRRTIRPVRTGCSSGVRRRTTSGEVAETPREKRRCRDTEPGGAAILRDFSARSQLIERHARENPNAVGQLRLLDAHLAIGQGDTNARTRFCWSLARHSRVARQHDLLAAVMLRNIQLRGGSGRLPWLLTVDPANARWWAGYAVTQQKLGRHAELIGRSAP